MCYIKSENNVRAETVTEDLLYRGKDETCGEGLN